ncbi:hypothetical protein QBC46DRAFT_393851 [Diplogelasinospora grovesii]|uniref:Uncharacterized protein n=1 Tax=Diplogelasinospora grovesii TaxID=303347 RepID=A0AAN6N0V0_9PEZI|nr:hypothetical protein QBC46DRAFT_393851 [Diplogelasinospora grovesii]
MELIASHVDIVGQLDLPSEGDTGLSIFLERLQEDFPTVEIASSDRWLGASSRAHWPGAMTRFPPKSCLILGVHSEYVRQLVDAKEAASDSSSPSQAAAGCRYRALLTYMGLVMAHEIIHMFIGFLDRDRSGTPPEIDYRPRWGPGPQDRRGQPDEEQWEIEEKEGESGHFWEFRVLGGTQAYYTLSTDRTKYALVIRRSDPTADKGVGVYEIPDAMVTQLLEQQSDFDFSSLKTQLPRIEASSPLKTIIDSDQPITATPDDGIERYWGDRQHFNILNAHRKFRVSGEDLFKFCRDSRTTVRCHEDPRPSPYLIPYVQRPALGSSSSSSSD